MLNKEEKLFLESYQQQSYPKFRQIERYCAIMKKLLHTQRG